MGGYILIVESDPVLQRRIGDTLKEAHYELASEAEGAWARRSVAVRTPDAIVVDTVLSDGDGFRLAEDLRREPETRDTPIFFVASRFRGASHRIRGAPPLRARRVPAGADRRQQPARDDPAGGAARAQRRARRDPHRADATDLPTRRRRRISRTPPPAAMETPPPVAVANAASGGYESDATAGAGPISAGAGDASAGTGAVARGPGNATPGGHGDATAAGGGAAVHRDDDDRVDRDDARRADAGPAARDRASRFAIRCSSARATTSSERPSSLVAETTDFTDNLKNIPFPRLLQRLYVRRATGSLLLLHGGTKKIVSFVEGYPVAVRSNLLSECLGQILLSQKMISGQALVESVKRMQKEKRRQGEILVEMGALSPYNLTRALVEQSEAKLFEIFTWRDGQFMFKQGDGAPKEALRLERSPAALVLEGIRRHYDAARQVAVLDGFAKRFVAAQPRSAAAHAGDDFGADGDGVHPRHHRRRAHRRSAEWRRDLARQGGAAAGRAVGGRRDHARRGALMTPEPEATRLAIQRHDLRAGGPTDADVSTEELIGNLENNPAVLSIEPVPQAPTSDDGDLPSGPLTGVATPLGSGPLSMVAQTVRTQDYFWALGVERSATGEEIDRAYESLARTFHADAYRQSPDEDRRLAQEIFDRLTEAHRVLRDPAQRRAYTEGIDLAGGDTQGGAFATRASDASGSTPTKGTGGGGTTAGNAAANALFDSGMEHLKARRHHEAVEAFRQAARLVPGEANFRAALGWSLFREAPADARAGRAALAELRRAIQIDGQNLRALHYLANYFAETGQPESGRRRAPAHLARSIPTAPRPPTSCAGCRRSRLTGVRKGNFRNPLEGCAPRALTLVSRPTEICETRRRQTPRHLMPCVGHADCCVHR